MGAGAGGRATTGTGWEDAAAAASTSPFSTWPRLPLPATESRSILLSAAILAADGAGGMAVDGAGGGGAATFGAAAGAAAPPAPAETSPSNAPIETVSPVSAVISLSTPAPGALTSSVTLSVSSSTSGSSARTVSPAFLNHLPTVASVIDSPSVGTRISIVICSSRREAPFLRSYGIDRRERHAGTHGDRRHETIFVREPAPGGDRWIGRLHRFERRQRGCFDDRDAIAARGVRDRAHGDHDAGLDPRHPVLAMAAHHQRFLRRHIRQERRPRRPQLAQIMGHRIRSRLRRNIRRERP